jgi:hypothetical protein
VPVRQLPVVFADTLKFTEPLPVPPLADVIVMNDALLVAAHAHVDGAVTATVPVPPDSATV